MPPLFLDIERVLRIHRSMIEVYGGAEEIRDLALLQSALAMPRATFDGQTLHADLFEMAAAYLYHIVCNHPFLDGNKRTGAATAIIFLAMNEIEIEADEEGLVELTLSVAQGQAGKQQIAEFFDERQFVLSSGHASGAGRDGELIYWVARALVAQVPHAREVRTRGSNITRRDQLVSTTSCR